MTENNNHADRNLAMELVRATEAAAIASGPWVGAGDKNRADGAAVDAMRYRLSTVHFNGTVVIGEGEKDKAPMLFNGEVVGDGIGPNLDIAVDPIDGTRLTALGMDNALSVIAVADGGSMFDPSAVFYMEKLVTGPEAAEFVDLRLPVKQNLHLVAKAQGKNVSELTVCVLDRPRHAKLIEEIRNAGARTRIILDGDVAGAIAACREGTGVDVMLGTGGTPKASLPPAPSRLPEALSRAVWHPPTMPSVRRRSLRGTILIASSRLTIWSPAITASSLQPVLPTANCCAGCATARIL